MFLNKITNTLKKADENLEADQRRTVEEVIAKVADHLFSNISGLDPQSVLQTLKVVAYSDSVRVKPTRAQLVAVEDKIMVHLPEYLKSDISIPLVCMLKLKFYPQAIFNELNQM